MLLGASTAAGEERAKVEAAALAAGESDDAAAARKAEGRGMVRARLRARLIERCVQQLVEALEERHGKRWGEEVLEEGFLAHQAMLRFCESFGLRPHMEAQVLWTVRNRAQEQLKPAPSDAAECSSTTGAYGVEDSLLPLPIQGDETDEESNAAAWMFAEQGPLAPESDVAWSPTPSPYERSPASSVVTSPRSRSSAPPSALPSPAVLHLASPSLKLPETPLLPELAAPGAEVWQPKRQCSGDGTTVSCTSDEPLELAESSGEDSSGEDEEAGSGRPQLQTQGEKVKQGTGAEAAEPGHGKVRPWTALAVWALGGLRGNLSLLRGESGSELPAQLTAPYIQPMAHTDSTCLPLHPPKTTIPALTSLGGARHRDKDDCSLHFAGSSDVCFFIVDSASAGPEESYQRCIQTKVFDGPSGHKARRRKNHFSAAKGRRGGLLSRLGFGTGSMLDNARVEASVEDEDEDESEEEEPEEDWRERCDEIAELMCQQRHSLLWSASW